jgi:hypothetical protein
METAHWKHGDKFQVLDLVAQFEFKSVSSLSFNLGKLIARDLPRLPEMDNMDQESLDFVFASGSMFVVIGWLDAHHPSEPYNRLRLRVGLPDRYISWESMRDLVPQVVAALQLPTDVPYRVHMSGLSQETFTEDPPTVFYS